MTVLHAVSADGTVVRAADDGRGPVVLVVHGGGESVASWDGVTEALAAEFRVVRIERRIYAPGATAGPRHSTAVEAADILAVAAAVGRPALLLGHSSGAVAALEAAVLRPDSFGGLFLYEPPVGSRTPVGGPAADLAQAAIAAGRPLEAVRIHLRDIVGLPADAVERLVRDPGLRATAADRAPVWAADIRAVDALGVGLDRYASLGLPVTLLEGELSPAHLRERLADLAAVLPDARVVTLPNCGHTAHRSRPRTVARAVRHAARPPVG
ncbi:alpha/beta fold hydrolase [Kitasatospora sp. NPDC059571]|uniref:alpha/beta fold hydrolase n=1 Tax=Kitasatospora sp. NPDC059571 TaxID=3346871 RepID=UPI00369B9472